jgi:hypothetical protein
MNKERQIRELSDVIEEYLNSGMTLGEFIKEHIFKEYGETGNKDLEDIAAEYFIDKLD